MDYKKKSLSKIDVKSEYEEKLSKSGANTTTTLRERELELRLRSLEEREKIFLITVDSIFMNSTLHKRPVTSMIL